MTDISKRAIFCQSSWCVRDQSLGAVLRKFEFIPIPKPLHLLACAKCGAGMWLLQIVPDVPDHDRRTFECTECKAVKVEIVRYR